MDAAHQSFFYCGGVLSARIDTEFCAWQNVGSKKNAYFSVNHSNSKAFRVRKVGRQKCLSARLKKIFQFPAHPSQPKAARNETAAAKSV